MKYLRKLFKLNVIRENTELQNRQNIVEFLTHWLWVIFPIAYLSGIIVSINYFFPLNTELTKDCTIIELLSGFIVIFFTMTREILKLSEEEIEKLYRAIAGQNEYD